MPYSLFQRVVQKSQTALLPAKIQTVLGLFILIFTSLSSATENPDLTVYTHPSFAAEWGPGPAVKTAFEQRCDCQLNY